MECQNVGINIEEGWLRVGRFGRGVRFLFSRGGREQFMEGYGGFLFILFGKQREGVKGDFGGVGCYQVVFFVKEFYRKKVVGGVLLVGERDMIGKKNF